MSGRVLPDLSAKVLEFPPAKRRGRRPIDLERLRALLDEGKQDEEIADLLGCHAATVRVKRLGMGIRRNRKRGERERLSRFKSKAATDRPAVMPAVSNPAFTEGRTIYPGTVAPVEGLARVLVEGKNHWKIGDRIIKGKWKDFPVFTLTLEERATCPISCALWRSCYGNHMNWARRVKHGPALEERLLHELAILQSRFPCGFAVRLHVLGDFYSVDYVNAWAAFLDRFPALHCFGFTHRWNVDRDPIAVELVRLVCERWDRFAIRFSNSPIDEMSTATIEHPIQAGPDAVICPQEMGQTESCATCALCWQSTRRITFLRH